MVTAANLANPAARTYRPVEQYAPGPSLLEVTSGRASLARGMSGPAVRALQEALNAAGATPKLELDGMLGPKTEAALKAFQAKSGTAASGVASADTLSALEVKPRSARRAEDQDAAPVREARAPRVGDKAPSGSVSAAQLQQADNAGRAARDPGRGPANELHVNVPWYSQFDAQHVPDAGNTACYNAAKAMVKQVGVHLSGERIQVATDEDKYGRVATTQDRTTKAKDYIDSELTAGRPVVVGVSHGKYGYNPDKITDHFVVVTGKGTDAEGRTYYTYHDPGTGNAKAGADNRFYVDPQSGNLVHDGALAKGYVRDRHSEVSMVMKNA